PWLYAQSHSTVRSLRPILPHRQFLPMRRLLTSPQLRLQAMKWEWGYLSPLPPLPPRMPPRITWVPPTLTLLPSPFKPIPTIHPSRNCLQPTRSALSRRIGRVFWSTWQLVPAVPALMPPRDSPGGIFVKTPATLRPIQALRRPSTSSPQSSHCDE